MMTPIACPQCGFSHVVHLHTDDALLVDVYACTTCFYEFVVNQWWPDSDDSEVCAADDPIVDDEDAAYAPPADSRSEE